VTAIVQLPANQPLSGTTGHPFALTLNVTVTGTGAWTDLSAFTGTVYLNGAAQAAYAPTVTTPSAGVVSVVWSAAQTLAMGALFTMFGFEVDCNLFGAGPYGLVAGAFTINPPGTSGTSSSSSALSVTVGATTLALAVSLGGVGGGGTTGALLVSNNLSDVANVVTARTNLGLGTAATTAATAYDTAGAAATAQAAAIAASNQRASNLSDVANVVTARTNLGLGTAATTAATAYAPVTAIALSGDTTGVTDTAAITAAETAANTAGGGVIYFAPGTYYVKSGGTAALTKMSNTIWQGSGRGVTVIQLAATAEQPILESSSFASLTLGGSNTLGAHNFSIRDLTFDGNAAGQTTSNASAGVRIFGYDFEMTGVTIRFCKATDGLYTEWGGTGGAGLTEKAMEASYRRLRIHDNTLTGAAWRNRGPHDSIASDIIIYTNTTSAAGYWSETTQGSSTYTVAAGSNGVNVNTFAGAGTLNVNKTLGAPTAGTLTVATGSGAQTVTYTGTTANTFTGCTSAGAGVMSTGGAVTPPSYTGSAALITQMHVWGSHSWAAILDCNTKITNSEVEGATTGQLLVRGGDCSWSGGRIFYLPGSSNPGIGIQIGDATNSATGFMLNDPDMTGFAGTGANDWAISIVASASGQYRAHIVQASGTAINGTFQPYEYRRIHFATQVTPSVAVNGGLGTAPPAPTLSNGTDNRGIINMGTGTSPSIGSAATVTFAAKKAGTPTATISPGNAATAALQPYVGTATSTALTVAFAVAPTASQAAGTYSITYVIDG
jgi:hypothetical protein